MAVGAIAVSSAAISKAAKIFGSEAALAKKIGVSKQKLNYCKDTLLPYEMALSIYLVTDGKVDINELRPDRKPLMKQLKERILRDFSLDVVTKKLLGKTNSIKVTHFRKEYGDLRKLIGSIEQFGLFDPVMVNHDMELVKGERRLQAFKELKKEHVPIIVVDEPAPVVGRVFDNFYHKPYTPEELVGIQKELNKNIKNAQSYGQLRQAPYYLLPN
jgi:DNA-binding transcriptional regulator YdaS (Cro superfamily)